MFGVGDSVTLWTEQDSEKAGSDERTPLCTVYVSNLIADENTPFL